MILFYINHQLNCLQIEFISFFLNNYYSKIAFSKELLKSDENSRLVLINVSYLIH